MCSLLKDSGKMSGKKKKKKLHRRPTLSLYFCLDFGISIRVGMHLDSP